VGVDDKEKLGSAFTTKVTVALCRIPPPFPVTVMGYIPTAVLDPTARVIVELPPPGAAIVPGFKLTVAPVGAPVADRLIELLKPPLTVVVTVEVPWFPCTTLTDAGEAETVKLGAAVTTRVTVVVLRTCPLLPVIASGYVPTGVEELVVMLSVVELEVFKVGGLNVPVAPMGSPLTLKSTVPVNPLPGVSVTM
jgi:hypothetical protein